MIVIAAAAAPDLAEISVSPRRSLPERIKMNEESGEAEADDEEQVKSPDDLTRTADSAVYL